MMREGLEPMGGELALDLVLSPDRLTEFRRHTFDDVYLWTSQSRGKLAGRARNALSFFSRARNAEIQKDRLQAFISSMIALESLFSRDSKTPLRATLADSVALLTESSVEARITASKRIKKLYDRRSEIVHAGNETLPQAALEDSLRFCSRSIFETLILGASWGDCSDERLFEDLDRRKFS
jgi:Apea-like HEPN